MGAAAPSELSDVDTEGDICAGPPQAAAYESEAFEQVRRKKAAKKLVKTRSTLPAAAEKPVVGPKPVVSKISKARKAPFEVNVEVKRSCP